jgi:hypothetical protein
MFREGGTIKMMLNSDKGGIDEFVGGIVPT